MRSMIIVFRGISVTKDAKMKAPMRKSIWSRRGSSFPRLMLMRRLKKLFTMSPIIAPDARRKPRVSVISVRLRAERS